MKKILLAVMAVSAIGFTSCGGNKTEQGEAVDSVALIDSLSEEAIQETLDALNGVIDAKDADKLKEVLEDSKAKVAELVKQNPELAKAYVAKLQKFLKENKDKVSEFAGKAAGTQDAIDARLLLRSRQTRLSTMQLRMQLTRLRSHSVSNRLNTLL